jgi:RNA polymerase sigma-70 factor (ECF subfamily)
MGNWQETELVERCRKGDRQALGELLGKYEKPVYNVAFRILGNRDDAADITQSVFLKVFEKLDQYKPEYRFFSWIYRIAVNESINQNKQGWRQKPFSEKDSAAAGTPESEFEASKLSSEIQGGLMTLGENYRTVLVLRHFSGLSYREISDTLDIPEKTVKSRLYSARQMMKQSLETRGVL